MNDHEQTPDAPADATGDTLDTLIGEWLALPDVAEAIDEPITRVHRLLDNSSLLQWRVGERRIRSVPAEFIVDGRPLDSLRGTVIVLSDGGYSDEDILRWLFTEDPTLPGRPIDALRAGRKTEIRRRAQAMGW